MTPLIIPSKWYTEVTGRQITLAVLHRQEAPVRVGVAEATARFFQNLPPNHKASAHRIYDPGTVVQGVEYKNVAYHCKGLNHCGIGFELPGYSKDDDWTTPPMESAMHLCAADLVECATVYQFPLDWLDYRALMKGARHGVTDHVEATKAGIMGNNHTDPGVYFPVGRFMEICSGQPGRHLTPPVAKGAFTGGTEGLMPNAGLNFITSEEAKLPGAGFYTATADGGIRAGGQAYIPSTGAWNYLGLDPTDRQGDRHCTGISPNEDGSPGYTQHFNDGTRFSFGPGKNNWP
jgi:hypothetical protein